MQFPSVFMSISCFFALFDAVSFVFSCFFVSFSWLVRRCFVFCDFGLFLLFFHVYFVVRAGSSQTTQSRSPRMPLALSTRMSHILCFEVSC